MDYGSLIHSSINGVEFSFRRPTKSYQTYKPACLPFYWSCPKKFFVWNWSPSTGNNQFQFIKIHSFISHISQKAAMFHFKEKSLFLSLLTNFRVIAMVTECGLCLTELFCCRSRLNLKYMLTGNQSLISLSLV